MPAKPTRARFAQMRIVLSCLVLFTAKPLFSQDTAPAYQQPQLSPSLLDFLTGMPIANKMKLMATPKLLRPPFAGAPVDTPKGLAAKIKAQQVDAKNRVAAVKFLGTVDCVAHPESQEMLLKAIQEDPAEKVRLEAVKAIQTQFERGHDEKVSRREARRYDTCRGCCGEDALNALSKVAYETDETGCAIEPSERVRKEARIALSICTECCYAAEDYTVPPSPQPEEEMEQVQPAEEGLPTVPPASEASQEVAPPINPYAAVEAGEAPANQTDEAFAVSADSAVGVQDFQSFGSESSEPVSDEDAQADFMNTYNELLRAPTASEESIETQESSIIQVQQEADSPFAVETPQPAQLECLRGYCVVGIKSRRLVKGLPEYATTYNGKRYQFSSAEAKQEFDASPAMFEPMVEGIDLVHLRETGERATGPFVCDFNGRLYFFTSSENRKEFRSNSDIYLELAK